MSEQTYSINDLIYLMERLRDPDTGCPWDIKQDYKSITPSTLEEAYEVVDAIEQEDYGHLKEELGDFLFQVIFYTQLAKEEKRYDFHDVVDSLTQKLVRRHPHVFPEGHLQSIRQNSSEEEAALQEKKVKESWERIKQEEREAKGKQGVLDDVPLALPALVRAAKLQKRAAKVGFDWPELRGVVDKLDEEVAELKQALTQESQDNIESELGDVLFTCVNLVRHVGAEPESVLRKANQKFERRFRGMEMLAANVGIPLAEGGLSPQELEELWCKAKEHESKG